MNANQYKRLLSALIMLFLSTNVQAQNFVGGGGTSRGAGAGGSWDSAPCFTASTLLDPKTRELFVAQECSPKDLANYMIALNDFFLRLAIMLAVLMIVIGGFQWMMAIGNASKISNAKETIQQALIGLILALTAVLIFSQIDRSFVQFNTDTINLAPGDKISDEAFCKGLFPKSVCENKFINKGKCWWRCNNPAEFGTPACDLAGKCIPGDSSSDKTPGNLTEILGSNFAFKNSNLADASMIQPLKCVSDNIGKIIRVTDAYSTSGHSANSLHYIGCAVDFTPSLSDPDVCGTVRSIMTIASNCGLVASNEYQACGGTRSVNATGDHVHVSKVTGCPSGRFVPSRQLPRL